MIGIIGAMQKEIDEILKIMKNINKVTIHQCDIYTGELGKSQVALMLSGIGKVNASMNTTLLLSNYDLEYVINIGVAGGLLKSQNVLDVVISESVVQHDFDTSYIDGEEGIGLVFNVDQALINKAEKSLKKVSVEGNITLGMIASGDQFIVEMKQLEVIKNKFPKAACVEMEAGSIAHVCTNFKIPFVVIRSLSDVVFNPTSHLDYFEYLTKASERSAKFTYDFINT